MSARSVCALSVAAMFISGGSALAQDSRRVWGSGPYDASRRNPNAGGMWTIVTTPPTTTGATIGTVSINELAHTIPGKAIREWDRAQKARAKEQIDKSIAHLQKALDYDPEFVAAHNNLGALFLMRNETDAAIGHLQSCVKLDPHNAMPVANLAVAYMMQTKFEDGEQAARRAIDLDRSGNRVRLILGLALVMQNKFTEETMQLLQRASADFAQARLLTARVYAAWGKRDDALAAIDDYERSGDQAGLELARDWKGILGKTNRAMMAKTEVQR